MLSNLKLVAMLGYITYNNTGDAFREFLVQDFQRHNHQVNSPPFLYLKLPAFRYWR